MLCELRALSVSKKNPTHYVGWLSRHMKRSASDASPSHCRTRRKNALLSSTVWAFAASVCA